MQRFIRLVQGLLKSIIEDVRKDFTPEITYVPYEPKVIGNKLKGGRQ